MPNQLLGVLLHTTAIFGLSRVRTELDPLLIVPSLAHHPIQTNRQSPGHGDRQQQNADGSREGEQGQQRNIEELAPPGAWHFGDENQTCQHRQLRLRVGDDGMHLAGIGNTQRRPRGPRFRIRDETRNKGGRDSIAKAMRFITSGARSKGTQRAAAAPRRGSNCR